MSKRTLARFAIPVIAFAFVLVRVAQTEPKDDGEWLYLTFTDPTLPEAKRVPLLTWLHPSKLRACPNIVEESFHPEHAHDHPAFTFAVSRVTPVGYEVVFQRVHPDTGQPLPVQPTRALFERAQERSVTLSEKLSVTGRYELAPPPESQQ